MIIVVIEVILYYILYISLTIIRHVDMCCELRKG